MKKIIFLIPSIIICLLLVGISGSTQAALIDLENGMVYDDVNDLTWLQDANNLDGRVTWDNAKTWASSLDYGGFDDWRLPKVEEFWYLSDYGIHIPYYNDHRDLSGPFENLPRHTSHYETVGYWSNSNVDDDHALFFQFQYANFGENSGPRLKTELHYAWALRDGSTGPSAVPEPATIILFGLGILGLAGVNRKKV